MVGTSEDWPYFYSRLISSSTSTNFSATVVATWRFCLFYWSFSHSEAENGYLLMFLIFLSTGSHRPVTKALWTQMIPNTLHPHGQKPWLCLSVLQLTPLLFSFFQVCIFCPLQGVSSNSCTNLLSVIFLTRCLWMLHSQGGKITWSQWKGFWNYRK